MQQYSFHVILECIYAFSWASFLLFFLLKNDIEILVLPIKEHLFAT